MPVHDDDIALFGARKFRHKRGNMRRSSAHRTRRARRSQQGTDECRRHPVTMRRGGIEASPARGPGHKANSSEPTEKDWLQLRSGSPLAGDGRACVERLTRRASLQYAANSLLVSINSLFGAIKFPVPISRELSSIKLILLRSVGQILAQRPNSCKNSLHFPC
jgi:hypothetical protein